MRHSYEFDVKLVWGDEAMSYCIWGWPTPRCRPHCSRPVDSHTWASGPSSERTKLTKRRLRTWFENRSRKAMVNSIWKKTLLTGLGIRSFAHCSTQMSDCERFVQIAQDKWATVSKLIRSLKTNEWPWANCSGRSRQMSDNEQIAQVTHDKWATVSDSLRSLMINEQMSNSLKHFGWTKSKILFFCVYYIRFFYLKRVIR